MNKMILPPKRFQSAESPKYDPIRSRPWFASLLKRKWQIPLLASAHKDLLADLNLLQKDAAQRYGVDERELRDYIKFKHNQNPEISAGAQNVMDYAYGIYCRDNAKLSFRFYLDYIAKRMRVLPRPIIELWEVCPDYYPTGYKHEP